MNIVERAKNMIVSPKTEWEKIDMENMDMKSVLLSYVLPLAAISAICAFIGYAFIGIDVGFFRMKGINWGIYSAVTVFVSALVSVIVSSYVVDMLAPSFASEKNLNKSAQLVGFSYTPALIGGFLAIFPSLGIIGSLFGLYGIYLWYLGLAPLKNTPEDKKIVYMVVSILVLIVVSFVIGLIMSRILLPVFGLSMTPTLGV